MFIFVGVNTPTSYRLASLSLKVSFHAKEDRYCAYYLRFMMVIKLQPGSRALVHPDGVRGVSHVSVHLSRYRIHMNAILVYSYSNLQKRVTLNFIPVSNLFYFLLWCAYQIVEGNSCTCNIQRVSQNLFQNKRVNSHLKLNDFSVNDFDEFTFLLVRVD